MLGGVWWVDCVRCDVVGIVRMEIFALKFERTLKATKAAA